MSANPIDKVIAEYREREKAAKAVGKPELAFELGNMIVGLETMSRAHEQRVVPLTRHTYFAEREDGTGTSRVGSAHADKGAAEALAAELWGREDNGFFHLPCYRVVREDGVVVSDPIDCYPGEC